MAATALVALAGLGSVLAGALALSHASTAQEEADLLARAKTVASAEQRVTQYRREAAALTADLARRQHFIEQMVDAHIGDLPNGSSTATDPKVSALSFGMTAPGLQGLRQIQAQQFALVDRLTRYADGRSATTTKAIRKLGLNPKLIAHSTRGGEGGPLETMATAADGSIDPRFAKMGKSFARMDALENGLASIPQVSPAHVAYVSSSFGYRTDPFTGSGAFHAGLDFPGPMGSPIYAAAKGTVTFVGQKSGYGNCVEVTHGKGLMTRYGHLSGFRAHVGDKVDAGALIAAMGSTGRSTGSHLHFEVRVNDKPVNPRSFLEAARNLQKEAS